MDVNVHPAKLSIRFHDEKRVREAATKAVSDALIKYDNGPRLFPGIDSIDSCRGELRSPAVETGAAEIHGRTQFAPTGKRDETTQTLRDAMRPQTGNRLRAREDIRTLVELPKTGSAQEAPGPEILDEKPHADSSEFMQIKGEQQELFEEPIHIIGNAYEAYWFVQRGKDIYVVDQHAAHERLNYDRLRESVRSGGAQQLLEPAIVRLSGAQSAVLSANMDVLKNIGFEVDEFGPLTWRVSAIPHVIGPQNAENFIIDALDALSERRSPELKLEALMLMACKASVRAGESITPKEIAYLFQAQDVSGPLTCPHGRPIMLQFTRGDLERLFKR